MTHARALRALTASLLLAACGVGTSGMLDPAGPQAASLERLWWLFVAVCAAVYVVVAAALGAALLRRRGRPAADAPPDPAPPGDARSIVVVGIALGATVVTLFVLLGASLATGRLLAAPLAGPPLSVRVIGHQWWWELRYESDTPSESVTTANELHLPVGRPILLRLSSVDVIHSLWIPSLQGKRDLIPGHEQEVALVADRPGAFRGVCAEFCGAQHAKMALDVVVHPASEFDAWLAAARLPAAEPVDPAPTRGREVFLGARCPMCHAITGTVAFGRIGPDLTHLASRRSLAAGTLPNTRDHLAGWIVDPQGVKPGARMPANELAPDDLNALLAYLESLT